MAQGGKRLLLGDDVFEYRAGQCLWSPDLPVTGHFIGATRADARAGPRPGAAPGRHRPAAAGHPGLPDGPAPPPACPRPRHRPAGPRTARRRARLLRLLDHPADAPCSPR